MNIHKSILENRKITKRIVRGLDISDNLQKTKEYAARFSYENLVCDSKSGCVECQYVPSLEDFNCTDNFITSCALTGVTNTSVTYNTSTQTLGANFTLTGNSTSTTKQVYKNNTGIDIPANVTSNTTTITLPLTYAEYIDNQLITTCKFRNPNCVINVNIPRTYSCADRDISSITESLVISGRTWFKITNTLANRVGNASWSYSYETNLFDGYTNNNEVFVSPKFSQYINVLEATKFIAVTGTDEFNCAKTENIALNIQAPELVIGTVTACELTASTFRITIPYTITNYLSDATELKNIFTSLSGATTWNDSEITIELVSPLTNQLIANISIGYVGSSTVWDSESVSVDLDNLNACVI